MIQSTLLAALGFLTACLLFLFIAPAFWARAVRLTTQKLRHSLPISEAEVRASKDLIRAEYAVKVHQLGKTIEKSRLSAHRQTIEINRRDAVVTRQLADIERLSLDLSEHKNAHGVLKQTINDRLPKLENGIEDARRLLEARDSEIGALEDAAGQQAEALEQAQAAYAQQGAELERLRMAMATAQGQDRRRAQDLGVETEYALRSELDGLRATTRAQANTIERLQAGLAGGVSLASVEVALEGDDSQLRGRIAEQAAELRQLRREVEQSQEGAQVDADGMSLLQHMRSLEAKTRDQADEIRRLRDDIERFEATVTPDAVKVVAESKAFLKSRLEKLEVQSRTEREVTGRLRAELASSNERAARQAVYFRDELRRLGTRSLTPVAATTRTAAERSQNAAAAASATAAAMAGRAMLPLRSGPEPQSVDRRAIWAARFQPTSPSPRLVVAAALVESQAFEATAGASNAAGSPLANGHANASPNSKGHDGAADEAASVEDAGPASDFGFNNDVQPVPGLAAVQGETSTTVDFGDPEEVPASDPGLEKRGRLLDRLRTYGDA